MMDDEERMSVSVCGGIRDVFERRISNTYLGGGRREQKETCAAEQHLRRVTATLNEPSKTINT